MICSLPPGKIKLNLPAASRGEYARYAFSYHPMIARPFVMPHESGIHTHLPLFLRQGMHPLSEKYFRLRKALKRAQAVFSRFF
jgi:hypothetical protein